MNLIPKDGKILGVRPEHLTIMPAPVDGSWTVKVQTTELLGAERLIYALYAETQMVIRVDSDAATPKAGDTLYVMPRVDQLHWFDAKTEKRIG